MPIPSHKTLEKLLDYSALKQKIIAQNIANADTKDYKRRDIEFKDLLKKGMQALEGSNKNQSEFEVKIDEESPVLTEGNNVDVNREMSDMAKNTIMFKFAAKKLTGYYQTLQGVIKGGN